jgi:hypothetical protein
MYGISVWNIPPLQQRYGEDVAIIEPQAEPLFYLEYDVSNFYTVRVNPPVPSASWYCYNPSGISRTSFDLFRTVTTITFDEETQDSNEEDSGKIYRYVITPTNLSPPHMPVLAAPFVIHRFPYVHHTAKSIRSGSNDHYLVCFDNGQLFIHLSTLYDRGYPTQLEMCRVRVPWLHPDEDVQVVACPFSGRVCLSFSDGILVMDLASTNKPPAENAPI